MKNIINKDFISKSQQVLKAVSNSANKELFNSKNQKALKYVQEVRKIPTNTINDFKVGFIPLKISEKIEDLFSYKAVVKACPDLSPADIEQILIKNGVVRIFESKDGRSLFKDVFGDRMLIPFLDKNDNVIGFTSRRIDAYEKPDFESLKYINSPESDVFHKREMFFGYDKAKSFVNNFGFVIVCEGTLDVIGYNKANKFPAVAGSGIAVSNEQCELIKSLNPSYAILSYDNDDAGMDAMLRNYEILNKNGIETKFINYGALPLKDIDELVNNEEYGPKTVKSLIDSPIDELDFLFKYYKFKISHTEVHNDSNDSKKISYKTDAELTDLDKFNIVFNVFNKYYEVHNIDEKHQYKIPLKKYDLLQNKLSQHLNIQKNDSKDLIYSFISLLQRKNQLKIKKAKISKENYVKPQWEVFENEETIHDVLDIIGAEQANHRGFYKSLWNNDSNPSLSVKRGQNLWKDFSSGYGGGIYQLVGYLDLSDPANIKVTDNPNQTTHTQAYNWLIKVLNSDLQQTNSTNSINSFMLSDEKKEEINTLNKVFENQALIACDTDLSEAKEQKQNLQKLYPDYFKLPEASLKRPPLLVPIGNQSCSLPIYSAALMNLSDDNKFITVNKNSKECPYFNSSKNENHAEVYFKYSSSDFLDKDKKLTYSCFICPDEANKNHLKQIFDGKYKTFNLINPSDNFIKNNFEQLSTFKKPIFVNGQDLYSYVTQHKLAYYTNVASFMAKNDPTNIFTKTTLNKMNSKTHNSDYYRNIYFKNKSNKNNTYPPK